MHRKRGVCFCQCGGLQGGVKSELVPVLELVGFANNFPEVRHVKQALARCMPSKYAKQTFGNGSFDVFRIICQVRGSNLPFATFDSYFVSQKSKPAAHEWAKYQGPFSGHGSTFGHHLHQSCWHASGGSFASPEARRRVKSENGGGGPRFACPCVGFVSKQETSFGLL